MRRPLKFGILGILTILAWPVFADGDTPGKPFELGVVPYMSARSLIASYEPMRLYLEQVLGKPVKIYTAAGFKPFFQNVLRGDYDMVITAAHFARILQKEQKFTPLLRYSEGGHSYVMAALNSPLKSAQDLRGQVISVPDQLSLAAIVCLSYLRANGLQPGIDFKLLEVPSFASAILSVQKGDAMAAISAQGALAQMPPELRNSVKPIVDSGEYLSLIFLAHPRLSKSTAELLNQALLKFGIVSNEGKQFFSKTGFGTIVPVSAGDMSSLDRYIAETKRLLDETP
jgi:phosphonate transport system substrate-binding protein